MKASIENFLKTKFALPAIAVAGVVLMVLIVKLQPQMKHNPKARPSVPVNTVTVEEHLIRPAITGFGTVEPDLTLQAKAEVSGRITYIHPELKTGEIIRKDTVMLRIDDRDYQLNLKQAQADLLSSEANLKEMQLTVENNKLDLKLANEKLKVRKKELARLEKLRKSGAVSVSTLDAERQNMLQQQQEVQQLKNTQITLPSDIEVLKAKIDISKAQLEQSKRDLARTEIRLPFNGRVSEVTAELDQFVSTGTLLFEAYGIDKMIVNAQVSMEQFGQLAAGFNRELINYENLLSGNKMSDIFDALGLNATIHIAGNKSFNWQAKVERLSGNIDSKTRTLGVIVSISDNYKDIDPSVRPPLLAGNYMQVDLLGAQRKFIAAPRFALHQGQIYRVSKSQTLERVDLPRVQLQGELALFTDTLSPGDKIVTSDVFPAVQGMELTVMDDKAIQTQLDTWVRKAQ
ncbi:efflux RND transporter periplasmic adaptor subunit [Thalassomonas haliotis]|uniref:Membrane fusion protein biotin-lipoyl like domain-containing protein n=1 Tax=Thalassomonas haliotis TaxID=485448 RepID=A0ABY7VAR6_9GAMM|nr:HlyD family efflux transporter periplasmic adaptor subunit [Thalassomonas haliotis]WDE10744.1 hypothetical protein H3N35_21230 [Thalassomonas haliotis]